MEGTLNIIIETDFLREKVITLTKLGCKHSSMGQKSIWSFPINKLRLVESILETKIDLNPEPIIELQNRYGVKVIEPEPSEEVVPEPLVPDRKKGLEMEEVIVKGEIKYVFYSYKKNNKRTKRHEVPKSMVDNLKEIIKNTDADWFKDSKIPVGIIQERIARRYGMKQFNNAKGKFNPDSFFGNRKYYFHQFYFPLKVLVHKGIVIHHKRGFISKIRKTKNKPKENNAAT